MAQLAIQGHATRGKEVIEILEILGGKSYTALPYQGNDIDRYYYINKVDNYINAEPVYRILVPKFQLFTLEQFLEKFPYKIGDRVRVPEYESEVYISKMHWDGNEVQYEVVTDEVEWYSAKELNEFNEPNKEKKINLMSLAYCDLDEVEIVLGDKFELKIENGKYYAIRKTFHYPKTYVECAKLLDCFGAAHIDGYKGELLDKFQELLICRDAYWKIAGEQMGLGKPWNQDYNDRCFIIANNNGNIHTYEYHGSNNVILAFPTEEMRDAFYEKFKELIETVKELL